MQDDAVPHPPCPPFSAIDRERSQLRSFLDAMDDLACIISEDLSVVFMNRSMVQLFGNHTGEICYQIFHGFPAPCPWCPFSKVAAGETVREERLVEGNGRLYEIVHTPLRDLDGKPQKLAVYRDITQRKAAENELIATRGRLMHLLTSSPAIIYACSPGGDFATTFVSDNIRDQLGYEPGQFSENQQFWMQQIHSADRPQVRQAMEDILRSGGGIHEYRFRRRDGSFRWMRDECRLVRDRDGNPLEIVGYWIDVTEQRQGEERLREANRELQSFVATVSHDLRTPLTPIIGFAEYLQEKYRDRLDDSALAILREIEGQGRRMMAVMEDLLVLSQVGNVPPPDRPVDVAAIVKEVLRALDEPIQRQGIVITVKKLPALAIPPTFLSQIFANLVGNAIRYAGTVGARIDIGGNECGDLRIIYVRDYGPGIPPEERERVFEPFYRGTTAGKTKGTGIGLATVRKIVRLYGGRIRVDETPGGGSTFRMEFPVPGPG